jgi:hypothetical protein
LEDSAIRVLRGYQTGLRKDSQEYDAEEADEGKR